MKQMEDERRNRKGDKFIRFLSIIYLVLAAAFSVLLIRLNVLPMKFLIPALALLVIVTIFVVPCMFSYKGKPKRKKVSAVIAAILILCFGVGTYYLGATLNFFSNIISFGGGNEDFYVVVDAESEYQEVSELSEEVIAAYVKSDSSYSKARNKLKEEINCEYEFLDTVIETLDQVLDGTYNAAFLSAANYKTCTSDDSYYKENTKVLYKVSIPVENTKTYDPVKVTKEPFNVYISGLDIEGSIDNVSRSDVNMIATVNPLTREVLLTAIPRDYYVMLPSKGAKDKLTHSGLYGIDETVGAIEDLLGLKINYYLKVNYSTVQDLVDAIGGIDVDSPWTFTTSGMSDILGSVKYTFYEGINHLNGSQALAFSRERHSFASGDMARNENQQRVMEAIIRKCTSSTTILTSYTDILRAVEGTMETNMSESSMTSLAKMQINDMSGWTITKQALKGEPDYDECYALGFAASVVAPYEEEVAEGMDRIMEIMNRKPETKGQ